jgi:vacuolar protein sorting-associated protein 13A/C
MIEKFSIETNRLALKINEEFIKTLISTTNKITQLLNDQQLKIIP